MTADTRRRLAAVLVAAAVLGGVGVADRVVGRPVPDVGAGSNPAQLETASAVVAGTGASSSAWYCPGVAAVPAGTQASVVLTNPRPRAVTGMLQIRGTAGSGVQGRGFEIPAADQLAVPVSSTGAARVLLDGGGVAAMEVVTGPLGWSAAPCASSTATSWYFAHGSTATGRATRLSLFNPTPADAVVDLTFVAGAGNVEAPPAYQGIPVPAGQVVVENLADHVQNEPSFATEVTALSGTVVAAEMTEAGSPGQGGLSIVPGSPVAASRWEFAQSTDQAGGANAFSVFNPSSKPANVTVSISLAQGQAAPVSLSVGPSSVATFNSQDQTRIPPGAVFGLTFSSGGPGIVVSRESFVPTGTLPTIGSSIGVAGGQRRWLVPAVPAPGTGPMVLAVLNVAGRATRVEVVSVRPNGATVPVTARRGVRLRPGGFLLLGPNPPPPIGRSPLEVLADGPVAVELDPVPAGAPGTVVVPSWALLNSSG